jgi:uncharacterized protein DUF4328
VSARPAATSATRRAARPPARARAAGHDGRFWLAWQRRTGARWSWRSSPACSCSSSSASRSGATINEAAWVPQLRALFDGVAAGADFDAPAWQAVLDQRDPLAIPTLAAYLIATVAFGAWLAVSVGNIPALGGGEQPVSTVRAFVSSVVPVYNLRKVPGIVQDVLYRIDPRRGGVFMVAIAWIGLAGSWIVGRLLGFYLDTRIATEAYNASSLADYAARIRPLVDVAFGVDVLVSGLISLGAVMLVVIMFEAERRAAARNREIEAELGTVA